jgi:UDP-N-acetylglucosamine 4-epimerase
VNFERDPVYREFRAGDVRHSQASIAKIQQNLGYAAEFKIAEGIQRAMPWYIAHKHLG